MKFPSMRIWIVVAVFLGAPGSGFAEALEAFGGDLSLRVPEGWTRETDPKDGSVYLSPPGQSDLLVFIQPLDSYGGLGSLSYGPQGYVDWVVGNNLSKFKEGKSFAWNGDFAWASKIPPSFKLGGWVFLFHSDRKFYLLALQAGGADLKDRRSTLRDLFNTTLVRIGTSSSLPTLLPSWVD